jgi:hypothetical protein
LRVTTTNPGLVMFVIDGSHSTGALWGSSGELLSGTIAHQTNRLILDLVVNAVFDNGEIRDRIKLSGYIAQGDDVIWALPGLEPSPKWLDAEQWANSGKKQDNSNTPVWVTIEPKGKTPLLKAWSNAIEIIEEFRTENPKSGIFLISLTDGDFEEIVNSTSEVQIKELQSKFEENAQSNNFTHMVVHMSAEEKTPIAFPANPPGDKFSKLLFDLSTWMPESNMSNPLRRAYICNADPGLLSHALELGSKVIRNEPFQGNTTPLTEED